MLNSTEIETFIFGLSTEDQISVASLALEKKKIAMRKDLAGQEINGFTIVLKESKDGGKSYLAAHKTYSKNKWRSVHIPIHYLDKEKIRVFLEEVEKQWKAKIS